jgi:hypothetical protein
VACGCPPKGHSLLLHASRVFLRVRLGYSCSHILCCATARTCIMLATLSRFAAHVLRSLARLLTATGPMVVQEDPGSTTDCLLRWDLFTSTKRPTRRSLSTPTRGPRSSTSPRCTLHQLTHAVRACNILLHEPALLVSPSSADTRTSTASTSHEYR